MPDQNEERRKELLENQEAIDDRIEEMGSNMLPDEDDLRKAGCESSIEHLERLMKDLSGRKKKKQNARVDYITKGDSNLTIGEKFFIFDADQKQAVENLAKDSQAAQLAFRESARLMKDAADKLWDSLHELFPFIDPDKYHFTYNHKGFYVQYLSPNRKERF